MNREEQAHLILAFAKVLFINGQTTTQILATTELLGKTLQINAKLMPPRWGELQLVVEDSNSAPTIFVTEAIPDSINMHRVLPAMQAADAIANGKLSSVDASNRISIIAKKPPVPTWLFSLGAGLGAVALSIIYGIQHLPAIGLIFLSAAIGGGLRRTLAKYSLNIFIQPFSAALLAGLIAALAIRYNLSSALHLIVFCPCMILVPGPHILNSALDIIHGRIHLGATRITYALFILLAISSGLLLGLACFGVYLPLYFPSSPIVPVWQDCLAAGVAVSAYSIFYSTPFSLLAWPLGVGMLAHMIRWESMTNFGASNITGSFCACLVTGVILTFVAYRKKLPFVAISFAAVVSIIPGIYIFKMTSGLLQLASGSNTTLALISTTMSDSLTAVLITLAMSIGLLVPKIAFDFVMEKSLQRIHSKI